MSDGAHLGFQADDSLKAVMSGEGPEEGMSPEQMAAYLESAPEEPESYGDGARFAGRGVLHYLREHPEVFRNGDAGEVFDLAFPHEPGKLDETWPAIGGITAFMVGWAVNAARYACEHNAVPNPAILEL